MTDKTRKSPSENQRSKAEDRKDRAAKALRDNLRRRKQQANPKDKQAD